MSLAELPVPTRVRSKLACPLRRRKAMPAQHPAGVDRQPMRRAQRVERHGRLVRACDAGQVGRQQDAVPQLAANHQHRVGLGRRRREQCRRQDALPDVGRRAQLLGQLLGDQSGRNGRSGLARNPLTRQARAGLPGPAPPTPRPTAPGWAEGRVSR